MIRSLRTVLCVATLSYTARDGHDPGVSWRELVSLVASGALDPSDFAVHVDHDEDDEDD